MGHIWGIFGQSLAFFGPEGSVFEITLVILVWVDIYEKILRTIPISNFGWYGTSNTVLSLSSCCLVLIFFSSESFYLVHCKKYYQYCNHADNILYEVYTNLAYVPPPYRRVKKLRFLMINKNVRKYLAHKKGNGIIIWIWNNADLSPM